MKKHYYILILAIIGVLFVSCSNSRKIGCDVRGRKPDYKYTPRLQGNQKWNYKQHRGPKRKLIK